MYLNFLCRVAKHWIVKLGCSQSTYHQAQNLHNTFCAKLSVYISELLSLLHPLYSTFFQYFFWALPTEVISFRWCKFSNHLFCWLPPPPVWGLLTDRCLTLGDRLGTASWDGPSRGCSQYHKTNQPTSTKQWRQVANDSGQNTPGALPT